MQNSSCGGTCSAYNWGMKLQTLLEKAANAGYEISREEHRVLVRKLDARKRRITSGVWISIDGDRFVSAFRTDIELALTQTIRSVTQTARILGV